jgi:hypothetical protein
MAITPAVNRPQPQPDPLDKQPPPQTPPPQNQTQPPQKDPAVSGAAAAVPPKSKTGVAEPSQQQTGQPPAGTTPPIAPTTGEVLAVQPTQFSTALTSLSSVQQLQLQPNTGTTLAGMNTPGTALQSNLTNLNLTTGYDPSAFGNLLTPAPNFAVPNFSSPSFLDSRSLTSPALLGNSLQTPATPPGNTLAGQPPNSAATTQSPPPDPFTTLQRFDFGQWVGNSTQSGLNNLNTLGNDLRQNNWNSFNTNMIRTTNEFVDWRNNNKAVIGNFIQNTKDWQEGKVDQFRADLVQFGEDRGGFVGKGLAQTVSNYIGFQQGVYNSVWSAGKGIVQLADGLGTVLDPTEWAANPEQNVARVQGALDTIDRISSLSDPASWIMEPQKNLQTVGGLWNGITEDYQRYAAKGDWAKFFGHLTGDIAMEFIPGAGQADNVSELALVSRATENLGEVATITRAVDGLENISALGRAVDDFKAGRIGASDLNDAMRNANDAFRNGGKGKWDAQAMSDFKRYNADAQSALVNPPSRPTGSLNPNGTGSTNPPGTPITANVPPGGSIPPNSGNPGAIVPSPGGAIVPSPGGPIVPYTGPRSNPFEPRTIIESTGMLTNPRATANLPLPPTRSSITLANADELGFRTKPLGDGTTVLFPEFSGPTAQFDRARMDALYDFRSVQGPDGVWNTSVFDRTNGQMVGYVPNSRMANSLDQLTDIGESNFKKAIDLGTQDGYFRRWRNAIQAVTDPMNPNRLPPSNVPDQVARLNEGNQFLRSMQDRGQFDQIILPRDSTLLPENRVPPWMQQPTQGNSSLFGNGPTAALPPSTLDPFNPPLSQPGSIFEPQWLNGGAPPNSNSLFDPMNTQFPRTMPQQPLNFGSTGSTPGGGFGPTPQSPPPFQFGEPFNPYDPSHLNSLPSSMRNLPPELLSLKMNGGNPPIAFVSPNDGLTPPLASSAWPGSGGPRGVDLNNLPAAFDTSGRLRDPYEFVDALSRQLNPSCSTYGNCGDIASRTVDILNSRGRKADLSPIDGNNPIGSSTQPIESASSGRRLRPTEADAKIDQMRQLMQNSGQSYELSIYGPDANSLYGGIPDHQFAITLNNKGEVIGLDTQRGYVIEQAELKDLLNRVDAFEVHPGAQ